MCVLFGRHVKIGSYFHTTSEKYCISNVPILLKITFFICLKRGDTVLRRNNELHVNNDGKKIKIILNFLS